MQDTWNVLVTGGTRGIGRAIAERLGAEGHRVAILGRDPGHLERACGELRALGNEVWGVQADLEQAGEVAPAVQSAVEQLGGRLDVLINNAGVFDMRPLERMDLAFWQRFLAINLTAPFLATQAALPYLRRAQGQVVQINPVAGKQGFPHNTAYCTTKYGLLGFSEALAAEVEADGLRVRSDLPWADPHGHLQRRGWRLGTTIV
ncbi:MAG: SDR family oxidoreductase [Planctomycetota bacterium]